MRDLARRLLAASRSTADPQVHEAVLVNEKLRITLTQFAGADGFASLMRRALALASAEVLSLQNVRVGADGRLEGFEQLAADDESEAGEAAVEITAQMLVLLVTFIGEPLTRRLVLLAWPDTSLDESHSREAD